MLSHRYIYSVVGGILRVFSPPSPTITRPPWGDIICVFFNLYTVIYLGLKVWENLGLEMRKPCCDKKQTLKEAWTKQEDQKLIDYIRTHGKGCWRTLPKEAGLHRCGKSCRLRWINYLRPDIKRGNFAEDEEDLIVKLHALLGNRWSLIAGRLPGRTDNEVKNYWNSHIRRKLINMGIDPNNHRLNQTVPHCVNEEEKPHRFPGIIKSSASVITPSKPLKRTADDEQLSDAANGLDDETLRCTCDLDLDLTIAFPSSSPPIEEKQQEISTAELSNKSIEVEGDPFPTLVLFR